MVAVGALVAIGVGKMTFGGLGKNPFNPALVGRVFMLLSFPVAMTTFPEVADAATGATPLSAMKGALASGMTVPEAMRMRFWSGSRAVRSARYLLWCCCSASRGCSCAV